MDRVGPQQRRGIAWRFRRTRAKKLAVGIGLRHRNPYVPNGQADLGTNLKKLQADGLALSADQVGVLQSQPAQRVHPSVSATARSPRIGDWRLFSRNSALRDASGAAPAPSSAIPEILKYPRRFPGVLKLDFGLTHSAAISRFSGRSWQSRSRSRHDGPRTRGVSHPARSPSRHG